jgi:hypothetical protein
VIGAAIEGKKKKPNDSLSLCGFLKVQSQCASLVRLVTCTSAVCESSETRDLTDLVG